MVYMILGTVLLRIKCACESSAAGLGWAVVCTRGSPSTLSRTDRKFPFFVSLRSCQTHTYKQHAKRNKSQPIYILDGHRSRPKKKHVNRIFPREKNKFRIFSTLIWYELTKWLPPLFFPIYQKGQLFRLHKYRVRHYYRYSCSILPPNKNLK